MGDEALEHKYPDLTLGDKEFLLSQSEEIAPEKDQLKNDLLKSVKENNMSPYYLHLCELFNWKKDESLLTEMQKANETSLKEIEEKILDAEEKFGESEVYDSLVAKSQLYCQIGSKEEAVKAYTVALEAKSVTSGQKLDIYCTIIRLGFFWNDSHLIEKNIEKAKSMADGADWDRKNRLKVYQALFNLKFRNFNKSSTLFLEAISTFTSYEICDYNTFILYSAITSIISKDRIELKKKVIDAPEILTVINDMPEILDLLNSLYNSNYSGFFVALAAVTSMLKRDKYLSEHCSFFCREMRIKAYSQLLESYKSVQLQSMAQAFGVSIEFLDKELSRFIASGRVHCKIDKVGGIVETNRPDQKNAFYHNTIKQGDLLLNRVQKLSRVVNSH